MEQNNDTLKVEDVFMLLETLKSNGTFDEIRKHCITDIYSKLTYQNWKQLIESNVNKFLSKVKFTPELNKNTVRERLRKQLLYGCETQDIEEGADRILTQVLAPHSLSIFEHKIAVAVDEYFGIKNKAPPIELNGLKESSMNLLKASNIEMSTVLNSKIDFIPDADNMVYDKTLKGNRKNLRSGKKEKSSSLCKESKSLKSNQSEDTNCVGGSSKQKSSQHKTSTSDKSSSSYHKISKKDKSCKEVVEKYNDVTNNPKSVLNKSKDVSKPKDIVDKSKEKSFLSKNSNNLSHKSNQTDRKRTKRSLEEKKKSSSFCKKPKLLNGNQNDDESNSGGSPRQKSTIHKNKSSSSDKTKSSSSNHKSSGRDNNTTDVVDRSKGKSLSKKSSSTDFINKSEGKSLLIFSDRTVDKLKDKYLSNNLSGTDVDGSKDKSLSKNYTSSDIDKHEKRSLSKNTCFIDIVDKSKNISLSKNSRSTDITDKYKIKSSLIKNTRCTGVLEKSKDKSLSKDSSSSSHKSNHTDTKRLKLSPVEKMKSSTNKVSDEERKPEEPEKSELNDFQNSIHSNNDIDVIMKDSASTLSNQILHEEIENNGAKVLDNDKSLYTFKGFSLVDAIPCKNDQLLKNVIKTLQVQTNNLDKIDNGFKGFTSAETNPCKHRDIVYAELIKLKESKSSTGFIGFSKEDTVISIGHKHVVKLLQLSKKRNNVNNFQQNVMCIGNGIQNGKPLNEVMAAHLYKSNNDNDAKSKKNDSPPINDTKKDSPTVNNNHNHDNWVVKQEIKYKLLPVVKLERLTYECNNTNRVDQVPI
ncbi:biorientation of chromosomes in cell division protein 1-like 1 [Metopolophium dirhodum]|uniref:biorientation of chromosomes in cell division protein 1-like 1 n=1 Tax=Metopolophium dirhodum TaxID=44670 RepID=UPI0029905273|nr:biorientation of chromosomes in cell division protein 1-like 1 [Metopolophium dirhodum]